MPKHSRPTSKRALKDLNLCSEHHNFCLAKLSLLNVTVSISLDTNTSRVNISIHSCS